MCPVQTDTYDGAGNVLGYLAADTVNNTFTNTTNTVAPRHLTMGTV
ncbi:hypothetical protein [Variovorax sp. tm]